MRKLTAIVVLCFLSSFYTLSAQETKDNSMSPAFSFKFSTGDKRNFQK